MSIIKGVLRYMKFLGSGEHIDLSVFQTQAGPDKVVITVGGVYTIT